MTLTIGNYTRALAKDRSGVKATFKLSGPVTIGGIYQNVDMTYTGEPIVTPMTEDEIAGFQREVVSIYGY